MMRRTANFLVALCWTIGLALPAVAQDWCGTAIQVSERVADVTAMAAADRVPKRSQATTLARSLERLKPGGSTARDIHAARNILRIEMRSVAKTGQFANLQRLWAAAGAFQKSVEFACADFDESHVSGKNRASSEDRVLTSQGLGGLGGAQLSLPRLDGLAAVIGTAVFGAAVLVLINSFYLWLATFMFNRRSCLIRAELLLPDRSIAGRLTIMSRFDCRFESDGQVRLRASRDGEEGHSVEISVGDIRIPGHLRASSNSHDRIQFDLPLDMEFYAQIIHRSAISTHYVKSQVYAAKSGRRRRGLARPAYRVGKHVPPRWATLDKA